MDKKQFPVGSTIFAGGDPGNTAFLVETGLVEVSRETDGKKTVLGKVLPGGLFGEMALINDKPRMATATAVEDTVCFVIPLAVFNEELNHASALTKALLLTFIQHVRNLTTLLENAQGSAAADSGVQFFEQDTSGTYRGVK